MIIPPVADKNVLVNTLEHLDGLLLSGGADYNPLWCGEEPSPKLHGINAERDLPEMLITRLAYNRQIPILGICRGIASIPPEPFKPTATITTEARIKVISVIPLTGLLPTMAMALAATVVNRKERVLQSKGKCV